ASGGGSSGYGTVFKLDGDGSGFRLLHEFSAPASSDPGWTNADGASPGSGLTLYGGALFGYTAGGGTNGYGTIFKLNTDGSGFSVILHFDGENAAYPRGRLTVTNGTIYGPASYAYGSWDGALFKINTDGSGFSVIKTFTGNDGAGPQG